MGYTQIRDAIKTYLGTYFSSLASPVLVEFGDIDKLIKNMSEQGQTFGVFLEFGGGGRQRREQFTGREWIWRIEGVILLKYEGDMVGIENTLASVIDLLRSIFMDNRTLSGATNLASIDTIEPPENLVIRDMPFYWIPFRTVYMDKQ